MKKHIATFAIVAALGATAPAMADQALANYAQALLAGFAEVESALFAEASLASAT